MSFESHHALRDDLVVAEDVRLPQQSVYERGFAVVDVRDDGDISVSHKFLVSLGIVERSPAKGTKASVYTLSSVSSR